MYGLFQERLKFTCLITFILTTTGDNLSNCLAEVTTRRIDQVNIIPICWHHYFEITNNTSFENLTILLGEFERFLLRYKVAISRVWWEFRVRRVWWGDRVRLVWWEFRVCLVGWGFRVSRVVGLGLELVFVFALFL